MTIPTDLFRTASSSKTVPGLRRLVAGDGFDPGRVHVIHIVKTGFSHSTLVFPCQWPFLHSSCPSSSPSVIRRYNMAKCGKLQTKQRPSGRRQDWIHKYCRTGVLRCQNGQMDKTAFTDYPSQV